MNNERLFAAWLYSNEDILYGKCSLSFGEGREGQECFAARYLRPHLDALEEEAFAMTTVGPSG